MAKMKTCGDCIHADICKQVNGGWFSPKNIAYCKGFKDRTSLVEVVHAHWEDGYSVDFKGGIVYTSIDCSHCNEIFKTEDREYWKARFKVCPFCGAKMDGGNEDG